MVRDNSSEPFTTLNLTKFSAEPKSLMGSTEVASSVNYTIIFVAVAVFTILYLIFWYYCLKCCCYSIRQCIDNKTITRGDVHESPPQPSTTSGINIRNHRVTSDESPLIVSHHEVAPHSQRLPPYDPPRYDQIFVTSYQRHYQEWDQQLQQNSDIGVSNASVYNRISPPPPYEECLRT
ncbi:uncharacterized protein [Parasteatoda tepidariorum]|uniref:uncharacterized protein isoform X1 n=1 Tax=Parasteatoda tepidariorum TaxID=114398 RepID=UPI001C723CA4|nr:uncharacterized protein LOC107444542 isoform X1 [Parasteatoda tepidariorum]XP_042910593.1 uncharacterized protein LOC107444542 isoform X1 [Parasteatoda tepidariorum]